MNNFRFDEIFPLQSLFQSFWLWPVIDGFYSDLLREVFFFVFDVFYWYPNNNTFLEVLGG